MIELLKKKKPSTVLGLALEKDRLEGTVLRRSNGSLNVLQSLTVPLALNPFTGDPELVGREIRNHLNHAGVRERRCVVALPLNSAMFLLVEVPDMPEEDVPSFLQIEAERGFPYGQDALYMSTLRFTSNEKQYAALVAISRNNVSQIEAALKAAQLKPVSFSIGISALQNPDKEKSNGVLALALGPNNVDLQVTCDGGVIALRSLDEAFESEGVQKQLSVDFLIREIKITRGQLPPQLRDLVRQVRVFGRGEMVRRFVSDIMPRLDPVRLQVEWVEGYSPDEFPKRLPPGAPVSAPLSLAASWLTGTGTGFEFLPPKVRPWQRLTTRFSSRKLAWATSAAACLLLLVGGAFGFQQWQLSRLQTQWVVMEPKVKELEALQQKIKTFRPWFDDSFRSLTILRKVTEAFPEEGVVTAKTLEIRDLSSVTCSGVARDNQAFLKMLDRLRNIKEISDLKVDQVRGKTPMQFTFNFHWGERANEN
jgi:hypothetical protein